ncbi:glycine oxidase ThiO [Gloeocapsa sp. PCC 73106]|uniref:glycine oxidase ThiO n=1 Tax=Gloeocapsa sp. PCC 73106 TaxID=102232 RepID=UPI0002AD19FD|nr:glycine oxidase ThiO [Gloeocapsa sp. PCC 73106]ELR99616.1 glycine oxidase [Gloeocapsa sp. PCC 73106]
MEKTTEVLIIGGGINALAIAIDLRLRGTTVRVLSRNQQEAATLAAAGMLAPHAEQLPPGAMADLAVRSLHLYPEWIRKIEELTSLNLGYWSCGILAPVFTTSEGLKLDQQGIQLIQPGLGTEVVGGTWYPEDGQVDPRELYQGLLKAVEILGIELLQGITVEAIAQRGAKVESVRTNRGDYYAQTYVLAAGAWSNQLFPLPVYPVKGQMLALTMPSAPELPLQRVLYGPQIYLVPRRNGRLIVGATSEKVGYLPHNTPEGIQTLLNNAIRLYPGVKDWQIDSFWWGFRPGTPDELPILGMSSCDNLVLATGHYRNGILLAPVTASLIANLILEQRCDPLLDHFRSDRFYHSTPKISEPMTALIPSTPSVSTLADEQLCIAGKSFRSRLMTGTGKYPTIAAMQASINASGCEIVTVAVRRVQTQAPGHEGLAEAIDWQKIWMLPNTAGCKTADEAIRVARLGREMAKLLGQEDNNFIKLEVIPDPKYLLPDPIGTLEAAQQLVKEGFAVLPYINADPILAKRLEEIGCVTVMPLGSPIGSGQGISNSANIAIIIEQAHIPVVVDAGIGAPSEATLAMEMGADALLINSAIALAKDPVAMARAMGMATVAGRLAYLAGRIPIKDYASASSPVTGTIV